MTTLLLGALLGVVGIQFVTYSNAVRSARFGALAIWVKGSELRATQAMEFLVGCMEGRVTGLPAEPEKMVSVYECANAIGGDELEGVIRLADGSHTPPVPLRWL